jgi:hypothetical protein
VRERKNNNAAITTLVVGQRSDTASVRVASIIGTVDQGLQWQMYQAEAKCTEHLLLAKYTLFYTLLRKAECTLYTLSKKNYIFLPEALCSI